MDIEELKRLLKTFRICCPLFISLGDKYRQKLIFDIIEAGPEGINVSDLAKKTTLSRPAISHHLKNLRDNGIIVPHKIGTQFFYKINLKKKFTVLKDVVSSTLKILDKIEEGKISEEDELL